MRVITNGAGVFLQRALAFVLQTISTRRIGDDSALITTTNHKMKTNKVVSAIIDAHRTGSLERQVIALTSANAKLAKDKADMLTKVECPNGYLELLNNKRPALLRASDEISGVIEECKEFCDLSTPPKVKP